MLLEQAMARDPAKRLETAGKFADLLFAATRASRRQEEPKTAVAPPPPPPTQAGKRPETPAPTTIAAERSTSTRASETASIQVIPCPDCSRPIDITGHDEEIHCHACEHDFVLPGHTCPNCYHFHDTKTALCEQCGESINRACRHCYTSNWGGDDQCRECGQPLDIFELMSTHSEKATAERLQRQMAEAPSFKKAEEEASQKRMEELQAIEAERQANLRRNMQKRRQQERVMLAVTFGILFIILIIVVFALIKY